MLLLTGSTSLGALCSMGGTKFFRPVFPGGKFPSCTTRQFCMVPPNLVIASPGRHLLWHLSPFLRPNLQPGSLSV